MYQSHEALFCCTNTMTTDSMAWILFKSMTVTARTQGGFTDGNFMSEGALPERTQPSIVKLTVLSGLERSCKEERDTSIEYQARLKALKISSTKKFRGQQTLAEDIRVNSRPEMGTAVEVVV